MLTDKEVDFLQLLEEGRGSMEGSVLQRELGLSAGEFWSMRDDLKKKGLVWMDDRDRKTTEVSLTAEGAKAIQGAMAHTASLKDQLIKMGEAHPELQQDLSAVLDHVTGKQKTASDTDDIEREFKYVLEDLTSRGHDPWVDVSGDSMQGSYRSSRIPKSFDRQTREHWNREYERAENKLDRFVNYTDGVESYEVHEGDKNYVSVTIYLD